MALVPARAFGGASSSHSVLKGLDAFDEHHVALPRAVANYTVIRTTQVLNQADATLSVFGPLAITDFQAPGYGTQWSNGFCVQSVDPQQSINVANNAVLKTFSFMGGNNTSWNGVRMTPAAFTIKVMNPEALQTTRGAVYIGRAKQQLNLGGNVRTWNDLANALVSYSAPEIVAAGRLALRGVKVDALPYDMQSLSDFRSGKLLQDNVFTWGDQSTDFDGFAPIFVYNPDQVKLQILVCCEWRVRFDPENPAYASHTYHRPTSLAYWDRVQRIGNSVGNGVFDLIEKAAPAVIGNMAQRAVGRIAQGVASSSVPLLMNAAV